MVGIANHTLSVYDYVGTWHVKPSHTMTNNYPFQNEHLLKCNSSYRAQCFNALKTTELEQQSNISNNDPLVKF